MVNDTTSFGYDGTVKSKADWISTLTARIGFVADRALFYVKGGAAWTEASHSDGGTAWFTDVDGTISSSYYARHSHNRTGWTIGAGVEYAFAPNWTMFLEYDYYDFGDKNVVLDFGDGIATYKVDTDVSAVKIGVNYRFGGPIGGVRSLLIARHDLLPRSPEPRLRPGFFFAAGPPSAPAGRIPPATPRPGARRPAPGARRPVAVSAPWPERHRFSENFSQ